MRQNEQTAVSRPHVLLLGDLSSKQDVADSIKRAARHREQLVVVEQRLQLSEADVAKYQLICVDQASAESMLQLCSRAADTPIVVMMKRSDWSQARKLLRAGASDCVTFGSDYKPFMDRVADWLVESAKVAQP